MIIHGRKIIVSVGGTAIAASKSCDIETNVESIHVSSPSMGRWRRIIAGQKSWSVKTTTLVTGVDGMLLRVGDLVTLRIYDSDNTSDYVTGQALCTSCHITAQVGSLAQGSFAFEGNGELA